MPVFQILKLPSPAVDNRVTMNLLYIDKRTIRIITEILRGHCLINSFANKIDLAPRLLQKLPECGENGIDTISFM